MTAILAMACFVPGKRVDAAEFRRVFRGNSGFNIPFQDRRMEKGAGKLLIEAVQKYNDGTFWHATRDLIFLLDYYPEFSKADEVAFYLADCLYEMDMYTSSQKMFRYLISNFPKTAKRPDALLGLQKIDYVTFRYDDSLQFHRGLTMRYKGHEALSGSYYYGGMTYFHQKEYEKAIKAFGKVKARSAYAEYALYTAGLCYLKRKKIPQSVRTFRRLIALPVLKDESQDVITAAHLTLGYIYFELGFFQEAIKHYIQVPVDDETYKDALLARSWAAIKLEDYQQAIIALNDLIKISGDSEKYNEEAHFLLGQCYLELGFNDFAVNEFDYIITQFSSGEPINERVRNVEEGILSQRKMAEALKMELLVLETKLLEMLPISQPNEVPKYMREEHKKIIATRDNLIQKILDERKIFSDFQWEVKNLKDEISRKKNRKHWQNYAEYGKARAFFLKTIPGR